MPEVIRAHSERLAAAIGIPLADLYVEGSDGRGNKTVVPWVRVCSLSRSPSATLGWHLVYLFAAEGDRVFLSLNQGTSTYTGVGFVPRDASVLKARVDWARSDLVSNIELLADRARLGANYEVANVAAIEYEHGSVPPESVLLDDLLLWPPC